MLSRVAENLFWIGRNMERADNVARLMDAARRMVTLPRDLDLSTSNEWSSVLIAAGARDYFGEAIETASEKTAVHHLVFNNDNPSSVWNCFTQARENARAIRSVITQESWEALNTAWSEMRGWQPHMTTSGSGLSDVIDWVKTRTAVFRGAFYGTTMRGDSYDFIRMGMAIERTDSTARLIDVKYHVLLPTVGDVGSPADYYQWLSLLQAASAQRAYFFAMREDVSARGVADFLILSKRFPRSILFNLKNAENCVTNLEEFYGQPAACHAPLSELVNHIDSLNIEAIFDIGLHEFLTDVIERNYTVANLLAEAYGFAPPIGEDESQDGHSTQ